MLIGMMIFIFVFIEFFFGVFVWGSGIGSFWCLGIFKLEKMEFLCFVSLIVMWGIWCLVVMIFVGGWVILNILRWL